MTNTHLLRRSLAALLAACALAACDAGSAASPVPATLAGTYAGTTGTVAYHLVIPAGKTSPFAVQGTVTDEHGTREVHGTAIYQHPNISFELVRLDQNVESVFGVSGTVSESRGEISIPRGETPLTLQHQP